MAKELFDNLVAVAKQAEPETAPVVFEGQENRMIAMAIQNGNIDMLDKLLALRAAEEARQARIAFDADFVKLQAGLPAVAKTKENKGTHSKYAEIETIQAKWYPVVHNNGFACSWRYEPLENGDLRVFIDLSKHGHTRTTFVDMPQLSAVKSRDGDAVQNPLQVQGVRMSYGRRYSLVAALGGIVEGEDSDGQISTDTEVLRMQLQGFLEERDASGKFKLTAEAHDVIKKELAKSEPDLARLQKFYQLAKAKIGAVK